MLSRIFFLVLAASVLLTAFFVYYSHGWLLSIGAPGAALEGFYYYSGVGWIVVLISSAILLGVANVILWHMRRAWAIWTTFLYFAVFTLIWYFWLKRSARAFALTSGLPTDLSTLTPFIGVVFCISAAAFAYFDQFLVVRLAARMHPETDKVAEQPTLPPPVIDDQNEEKPPVE